MYTTAFSFSKDILLFSIVYTHMNVGAHREYEDWKLNSGLLEEQYLLVTSELPIQPTLKVFKWVLGNQTQILMLAQQTF